MINDFHGEACNLHYLCLGLEDLFRMSVLANGKVY